ncbi:MAG: 1-phosphofructokinase [Phycisphaerales bacterium]
MTHERIVTITLNTAVDHVIEAPELRVGAHVRAKRLGRSPGGKGVNVARILGALGTRSVATGFVGKGELGMFEEFLERVGTGRVVTQFLTVRGRTRDNITIMDPVLDTETHVRTEGFVVQREDVRRLLSKAGMLARPETVMCLMGSIPPGVVMGDLRTIAHRSVEGGARLVVDMEGDALRSVIDERMWMLKVNDNELSEIAGEAIATEEDALRVGRRHLVSEGGTAEVVIITRGAAGAVLLTPDGAYSAQTFVHPGRIAHTVGCGDALLAGVLHAWSERRGWGEVLKVGVGTATGHAVSREPGVLEMEAVEEFVSSTESSPVEGV